MSTGKRIFVSNQAAFDSTIQVFTSTKIVYALPEPVNAGAKEVRNDLSKIEGFATGSSFRLRVRTANIAAKQITDDSLTFDINSDRAAYFLISGEETSPKIELVEVK